MTRLSRGRLAVLAEPGHSSLTTVDVFDIGPATALSRASPTVPIVMDVVYGKERDLEKSRVLEVVARVPYMAWESVAYVAMAHTSNRTDFARRVYDRVLVARFEQDNEQWHLLILEELTRDRRRTWLRGRIIPQLLAVIYYQVSWMMFVVRPKWSYGLNADFEDHAAHEYAHLVAEHPEWTSSDSLASSSRTTAPTTVSPTCSVRSDTTKWFTAARAKR